MADQSLVHMLKQSVREFNEWRQNHPEAKVDLTCADFCGDNLSRANLEEADLRSASLCGAILSFTNLRRADLRGTNLYQSEFYRANLTEADLSGANLCEAYLYEAIGLSQETFNKMVKDLKSTIVFG